MEELQKSYLVSIDDCIMLGGWDSRPIIIRCRACHGLSRRMTVFGQPLLWSMTRVRSLMYMQVVMYMSLPVFGLGVCGYTSTLCMFLYIEGHGMSCHCKCPEGAR